MNVKPTTTLLMILDGWGIAPAATDNAIALAHTPQWNQWWQQGKSTTLSASGGDVGLPEGQMGNSEVGHMHIGAGRCITQDLVRLDKAIAAGNAFERLESLIADCLARECRLHLIGLVSDGGVHSHQNHLHALLQWLRHYPQLPVLLHAITDGRDTPPRSGQVFLHQLTEQLGPGQVLASISGRYYAMDRDQRWQRTQLAYDCLTTDTTTPSSLDADAVFAQHYAGDRSDEFITPTPLRDHQPIADGDVVICFNFRGDRMRQLCHALTDREFHAFERKHYPTISLSTFTNYAAVLPAHLLLPPHAAGDHLGACVAQADLPQLRIAETEKYPHVTYFFNGGEEQPLPGESRMMIPSPNVSTYDQQPQMSAEALTDALIEALESKRYALIVCNFANADMVGHTGDLNATIAAIEAMDQCFQRIEGCRQSHGLQLIITADHGNAEQMHHHDLNAPHTSHTTAQVPFVYLGEKRLRIHSPANASLIDIAPSVLTVMGLPIPTTMQGQSLLSESD